MANKKRLLNLSLIILVILGIASLGHVIYSKSHPQVDYRPVPKTNLANVVKKSDLIIVAEVKQSNLKQKNFDKLPATSYQVTVKQVLKGTATTGQKLNLYKAGAQKHRTGGYILYQGDKIPQAQHTYLFVLEKRQGKWYAGTPSTMQVATKAKIKQVQTYLK
ncbi:hypothetical protein [Ligilactobacillus equi]|uniref:Uncharacterized protein n=2 Tax=Ligilactobacillus equi TaxID=137357 RepID=V7HVT0_9LACO|nr:hypothetical protein [Ligilactobacillus equi]ETA73156.1 hypothetical protein LEQ_2161c [Ligilactobacillus equi DPC 6820]KRL81332.1 hypothetical protein FC36_GL001735 [Ligilactobacillus equi DSM 15833 = JCM 10991]MCQ2557418.1 hypothetical protein [Ligilactobacillus sp.]